MVLPVLLALAALACGGSDDLARPLDPLDSLPVGDDLSQVDLCQAIPQATVEAVMGHKLASAPERFEFYDAPGSSGCAYDAGEDSGGNALFGYVALTSVETYDNQPLYQNTAVEGIGKEAYFNNGADARQLWVKVDDGLAFVVAFGDVPNESGALALAKLLIAAIRR
jgi:hypothetical protein